MSFDTSGIQKRVASNNTRFSSNDTYVVLHRRDGSLTNLPFSLNVRELSIYSVDGKLIMRREAASLRGSSNEYSQRVVAADLSKISLGMYLYVYNTQGRRVSGKLLVEE